MKPNESQLLVLEDMEKRLIELLYSAKEQNEATLEYIYFRLTEVQDEMKKLKNCG